LTWILQEKHVEVKHERKEGKHGDFAEKHKEISETKSKGDSFMGDHTCKKSEKHSVSSSNDGANRTEIYEKDECKACKK